MKRDTKKVTLAISREAIAVLMMVPPYQKGSPKNTRRLSRIRANVFREIEALNKELQRHKTDIKTDNPEELVII